MRPDVKIETVLNARQTISATSNYSVNPLTKNTLVSKVFDTTSRRDGLSVYIGLLANLFYYLKNK